MKESNNKNSIVVALNMGEFVRGDTDDKTVSPSKVVLFTVVFGCRNNRCHNIEKQHTWEREKKIIRKTKKK